MKLKRIMIIGINKISILFVLLLFLNTNCTAQKQKISYSTIEEVDTLPVFQGGIDSLQTFLYDNFEWTSIDFSNKGYIVAEFIVNPDGDISDVTIKRYPSGLVPLAC